MAVPTHFRFTLRGIFSGTLESWSFGFHMGRNVDPGIDAGLDDISVSTVDEAVSGLFGSGCIDGGTEMVDWRAYVIGTDGKMQGNGPLLREYAVQEVHGLGAVKYPPQVALCISLLATNRGPGKFGRFYLPGPAFDLDNSRRLTISNSAIAAAAASAFLKKISDAIDLPNDQGSSPALNVSSRPGGGGTKQEVDHVEVGRVLDTMRSRRNQLLEERYVDTHIDW